jgi:hypothetical protein
MDKWMRLKNAKLNHFIYFCSREDPLQYISLSCEISAPPFILIAILIFLFKKWMVGWSTGPPAVETALEGIQSHFQPYPS